MCVAIAKLRPVDNAEYLRWRNLTRVIIKFAGAKQRAILPADNFMSLPMLSIAILVLRQRYSYYSSSDSCVSINPPKKGRFV